MQSVLTSGQIREVDRLTTERYAIPSLLLMENAAHAVARVITEKLAGSVAGTTVSILCGTGNNGGDGAALARVLWTLGASVGVFLLGAFEDTKGDARSNFEAVKRLCPGEVRSPSRIAFHEIDLINGDTVQKVLQSDVIVDAVFGTGLNRPLDGPINQLFAEINEKNRSAESPSLMVSVDMPSGLNADSAADFDGAFNADITVTFTAPKPANVLPPNFRKNGELYVMPIGTPSELIDDIVPDLWVSEASDVSESWIKLTGFSSDSYKNKRGHALVIAGSDRYSGAAILAGDAAMRSGVGLVTVAVPSSIKDSTALRILPEVMIRGTAEAATGAFSDEAFEDLRDLLEMADAVSIGCGLSQSDSTRRFVEKVIRDRKSPTIADADALNVLSPFNGESLGCLSGPRVILTPHEGEFMRLLGTDDKERIRDRVGAVRGFAREHNVILVLKGERVLIGEPGGRVVVNPTGNSGLGKAGNGDTLTGILAGFAAQAAAMHIDIFDTVVAAVYVAGMAGDVAEQKFGKRVMTASDVRDCLSDVFEKLEDDRYISGLPTRRQ